MSTPTQKQRALYWQVICLLFNGGEPALIKALQGIAATHGIDRKRPVRNTQEPAAYIHKWKPSAPTAGQGLHWNARSPHGEQVEIIPLYTTPPAAQSASRRVKPDDTEGGAV